MKELKMSSVNKVTLLGRLGRDPETRTTSSGKVVVSLAIATSEKWKDKNSGEQKEKTEWHRVVIMNQALAKVASDYLKKGSQAYIEGSLVTRKWQDSDGNDKFSTEIFLGEFRGALVLLDKNPSDNLQSDTRKPSGVGKKQPSKEQGGRRSETSDYDDEAPF